ncbi:unnamed protein product [Echinostoma caproni]|uniref:BCL domain-containing protein n=1 Tax=Echinostoma caproni TaxID=27848 RepID=A0A183A361_9TREM|nr:unnamed protein product [Echinostoma caproni]
MTSANPSAFYEYTKALCQSFLFSSLSKDELSQISLDDKKLVDILITLAGEFDRRFSQPSTMEQTMRQLDLSEDNLDNIRDVYIEVLNGMFRKLNWGRIVAMLASLRMLAMYLLKRGRRRDVDDLIESTAMYCDGKLRIWIQRHGGWVSFICAIHAPNFG